MPYRSLVVASLACSLASLCAPAQQVITETFQNSANLDLSSSSGLWGSFGAGATPGRIGGDARHGAFSLDLCTDTGTQIAGRQLYLLSTDNTLVPASQTPNGIALTVSDGRFYFTRMHIPANVHVRVTGSVPAVFTVAGVIDVDGVLESDGESVTEAHIANLQIGQSGGQGGAFAGSGGQGADRCQGIGTAVGQYDGRPGGDVNVLAGHAYLGTVLGTGGRGASLYPASGLNADQQFGTTPPVGLAYCLSATAGGSGGGHHRPGLDGRVVNVFSGTTPVNNAAAFMGPVAPGGSAVQLLPFPPTSGLMPSSQHFLVGGAGGGGAASNCTLSLSLARAWASGAGAGGGGGALALRAGRFVELDAQGEISAAGGSAYDYVGISAGAQVAPAGGGSGGSIVLQAGAFGGALDGAIDVRGGDGGFFRRQGGSGFGPNGGIVEIQGGDGGAGFVRYERVNPPTLAELAGMMPAATADNVGALQERDAFTSDLSSWYATGQTGALWDGYEALVDLDGNTTIDVTYDDSALPGSQLAFETGGPTTLPFLLQFQAAATTPTGQVDPAGIGPWRPAVGPALSNSIASDGGAFVRFRIVWNRALFPSTVLRELRIRYFPNGSQLGFTTTPIAATTPPPAVSDHAVAPLPNGGALLFGGRTTIGPFAPTFALNGSSWTKQLSVLNPLSRTGHALVLDQARAENVLFGGADALGGKLGDTWTFQNAQWSLATPSNAPSPRSGHMMAFDPTTSTCVLYGGEDASGQVLADLWRWDGNDWTQLSSNAPPGPRRDGAMVWDRFRGRLVLTTGDDGAMLRNDLWEWDGSGWTNPVPQQPSASNGPTARAYAAAAFDLVVERTVLYGGQTASGCASDAWTWDGSGWTRMLPAAPPTPSGLERATLHSDQQSLELLLFGGECGGTPNNQLWRFELPVFARAHPFGSGCAGSNGTPTLRVVGNTKPLLGTSVDLSYDQAPVVPQVSAVLGAVGWSRTQYLGLPLPLDLSPAGLVGCTLYQSANLTVPLTVAPNAGAAAWSIAIPNNPQLIGGEFFVQGLHPEPPTFGNWAALSNALALRIGAQ